MRLHAIGNKRLILFKFSGTQGLKNVDVRGGHYDGK